jgi:hypothetical protein
MPLGGWDRHAWYVWWYVKKKMSNFQAAFTESIYEKIEAVTE